MSERCEKNNLNIAKGIDKGQNYLIFVEIWVLSSKSLFPFIKCYLKNKTKKKVLKDVWNAV